MDRKKTQQGRGMKKNCWEDVGFKTVRGAVKYRKKKRDND